MTTELASARLKLGRAHDHLVALHGRVKRFLKADAYSLYSEYDPDTTEHDLCLRVIRQPKLDAWALVIGDIVHNLRAALDHVVWELTIQNRGTEPPYPLDDRWMGIEFPIFRDERRYLYGPPCKASKKLPPAPGSGLHKIRGVDPALHALFECLQPFQDGPERDRNLLQVLHDLDIIDKHRNITVLASLVKPEEVGFLRGPIQIEILGKPRFEVVKIYKPGPFKNGTPLARIRQTGKVRASVYSLPMYMNPKLAFEIQLGNRGSTMGLPVLPTLRRMVVRVEEIIEMLESSS